MRLRGQTLSSHAQSTPSADKPSLWHATKGSDPLVASSIMARYGWRAAFVAPPKDRRSVNSIYGGHLADRIPPQRRRLVDPIVTTVAKDFDQPGSFFFDRRSTTLMFYPSLRRSPIPRADLSLREVITAHYQSASSRYIVEWQSFRDASVGAVPAPLPVRRVTHKLGPHRIEIDVPCHALRIPRTIEDFADKSALPHVTHLRVSLVPRYCVKTVQSLHTGRQILLHQLQDDVMMIRHQHPVQHLPGEVLNDAVEQIDKVTAILVGAENVLTTATAPDDMNRNSDGFLSIATGHMHEKSTATVIAERLKRD